MTERSHDDLLIIGAGHLGGRAADAWLRAYPKAPVVAETRGPDRHPSLAAAGVIPRLRDEAAPRPAANLLFSVPPSAVEDYAAETQRAVELWSGTGRLVMTSSTAVYAESRGGICTEASPLANDERAVRMLAAEATVRAAGGVILRLAGLYERTRGPQRVFLRRPASDRRPDGLVNLIHYEDATSLCLRALEVGAAGAVYLGCDDLPLTREALVAAAWASGVFDEPGTPTERCDFTGRDGPLGRRCDNAETRRLLDWAPRYRSFTAWLASERRD